MKFINTRKHWTERLGKRVILNILIDFCDSHRKDKRNASCEFFFEGDHIFTGPGVMIG